MTHHRAFALVEAVSDVHPWSLTHRRAFMCNNQFEIALGSSLEDHSLLGPQDGQNNEVDLKVRIPCLVNVDLWARALSVQSFWPPADAEVSHDSIKRAFAL